jgi:hypothetical protein
MANTVVVYPGDGVTRQFTVPFDYLNRTFVRVSVNGTEEAQGVTWSFISPTVIERAAAPLAGETLTIRRVTSTNRIVDFKDASVLRSFDLNTSQLQVLHIAEEAKDMTVDTISTDIYGNLDARWRRITHIANPVENGDALNYGTYKADLSGAAVARDRAETAATKAEASAVTSKNWADAASSHKVAAEGSATTASTAATTATNAAAAAATSASKAETSAFTAHAWTDAAKSHADAAKSHADAAKVSEDAAQNVVDNAIEIVRGEFAGYVSDAEGSMTAAKGWSDQAKADADRAKAAADSVDVSVFESRVSALEDEDVSLNQKINNTNTVVSGHTSDISTLNGNLNTVNSKVTTMTTRVGNAETNITSLTHNKLNKSGGEVTGDLSVRGAALRNSFNNLNFNTSTSKTGLTFEWAEGTGKTWANASNVLIVYHEFVHTDTEWMVGMCGGWKVNGEITTHSLHLAGSGKLMVDRQEVRYVKQSYLAGDLTKWYRLWSDGWIEQGGTLVASGNSTINYPTPFANNWGEIRTLIVTPASGSYGNLDFAAYEANNTSFNLVGSGWSNAVRFSWFACGF